MDAVAYLKAVRKSWWIVVLVTIVGVGLALGVIVSSTPTYVSTVSFFVNTTQGGNSALLAGDQYAQQRVASYVILINQERLANLVIADTKVHMTPAEVSAEIAASAQTNTVILNAQVTDTSPQRSLQLATSVAEQFVNMVKVIDPAVRLEIVAGPTLAPDPVSPRKTLDLSLGILVGLVLGIALAVLRAKFSKGIRSVDALRTETKIAVVGDIGLDRSAKSQPLLVEGGRRSSRNESYRQLRTALQFVDVDSTVRVILVTSAVANEGKSTTASNLAIVFADTGQRVLLIEADLRRPRIADFFGLERAVGLSNVLAGQVEVEEVLQPWGNKQLFVLTSGSIVPNPSEILGSLHMAELVKKLRDAFDVIVIDSPPLLPVTDAAVTSAHADGVLLVVRAAKTSKGQIMKGVETLSAVDARLFGAVLNMTPVKRWARKSPYGGYGSYQNGPSTDHPTKPSRIQESSEVITTDAADSRLIEKTTPQG